jgi:hypothetical protein
MKAILYTLIVSFVFFACTEEKERVLVEVPALKASDMYRSSEVREYIVKYADQHHEIASSYKEKATAIKDKDLKKAIYFLKRSITLEPTQESYKELIQLLSQDKNYSEALDAYSVFVEEAYYDNANKEWTHEYIFSKPDEVTVTDYIIMSILANNSIDYYTLSLAGEGVDKQKIRERLLADERFKYDTSTIDYKNIMVQFWTEEEIDAYKKSLVNLNALLNSVSDTLSVFEIDQKNVSKFNYDDFNGMNYSEDDDGSIVLTDMVVYYLKEKQDNPNEWIQYNINHSFHPHDSLKALVYAVDTSATACPMEMREIYHRLIVYDAKGKIVSDKIIACQSGENLQTVSYNKDHFEITEYKRNWKKPYKKHDFDNEIIKTDLLAKKSYMITASGEIVEDVPVPLN